MNLSSTRLVDLIALLHEVLSEQPEVTAGVTRRVVEYRGRTFALVDTPVRVEGPFASLFDLVTSLGTGVPDGEPEGEPPRLWRWDGRSFELDHVAERAVRRE